MKIFPANFFEYIVENRAKLIVYSLPVICITYIVSLILPELSEKMGRNTSYIIAFLLLLICFTLLVTSILSSLFVIVLALVKADIKKHLNYGWIYLPLFVLIALFLTFLNLNSFTDTLSYSEVIISEKTEPVTVDRTYQSQPVEKQDQYAHSPVKKARHRAVKIIPIENNTILSVYYATNRKLESNNSNKLAASYSTGRSKSLSYGICDVSIPRDHKMGQLESPSIWRLEFSEDTNKHVVIKSVKVASSKAEFYKNLSKRVNDSLGSNAFIFIHGYNVTFEAAAKRTAQISYDIGFQGAPVFFSWPSQGTYAGYSADEATIELSQVYLKLFLNDFLNMSKAKNIYLIAHSMGNRALTRAVTSVLNERPKDKNRIREILLTAPDIDADVFKEEIAPALIATKCPLTLYVSSKDKALVASQKLHRFPRAGDSKDEVIILKGMNTIDASNVDTDFLGHTYISDNRSVLADVHELIILGLKPEKRKLKSFLKGKSTYWKFKSASR